MVEGEEHTDLEEMDRVVVVDTAEAEVDKEMVGAEFVLYHIMRYKGAYKYDSSS